MNQIYITISTIAFAILCWILNNKDLANKCLKLLFFTMACWGFWIIFEAAGYIVKAKLMYIGSNEGKYAIGNRVLVDDLKGVVVCVDSLRTHLGEFIIKLDPNQNYRDPKTYELVTTGENSYTSTQNAKWDPE